MTHANAADLEAIRLEYRSSLSDLTFNSKPIITNLTIIAQENLPAAPAIVRAIEDQLRNAQPKQKLPVFYLLDSILKNVGNAYIALFEHNIVRVFTTAYEAVENDDRQRFVKVLATWKNNPSGPMFAPGVIAALEGAVARIARQPARRPSLGAIHVNPNFVELARSVSPQATVPPASVLHTGGGPQYAGPIRADRGQQRTPYDRPVTRGGGASARGRPDQQVPRRNNGNVPNGGIINNGPANHRNGPPMNGSQRGSPASMNEAQRGGAPHGNSEVDVRSLQRQIQNVLAQKEAMALLNPLDATTLGHVQVLQQLMQAVQTTALDPASVAQIGQMLQQYAAQAIPVQVPQPQPNLMAFLPGAAASMPMQAFNFGLPALAPAALVQPTPTPFPNFGNAAPQQQQQQQLPSGVQNLLGNPDALKGLLGSIDVQSLVGGGFGGGAAAGRSSGMNMNDQRPGPAGGSGGGAQIWSVKDLPRIRLVHEDLNKTYPDAFRLLYEVLDAQCRQCGTRYPRDDAGRAKMDAHLDWHFRQNRRSKEKAKKAISRDWFVGEDEWVAEREVDVRDRKAPTLFFDHDAPEKSAPAEVVVNIPAAGEANPRCAVCTEQLEKFYDEESDDWMLRGAVRGDDNLLYHQACFKDAQATAAAAPSSRTGTPPAVGTPPPLADSAKRKREAEDDDSANVIIKTESSK
ncbi:hypothetical protein HDU87_005762 [Geranomyces variabilis]|uniref:CID domain-containing protein n=1 Tax=Geranomyces variabilis TaxID=109894 RepID=A0AAD5TLS8_9FUNG|nr:hypothetical protein HDU87_005762 [Geranomyces variabilis]